MDKAFIKGLRLIEALACSESPRGVTELALELQMTKSNVHRLLGTLQAQGYVRQTGALAAYELTPRIWEFGCRVMSRFDLAQFGRPAMQWLAECTKETVHLSILDGLDVVYLDKIESAHSVRAYTRVGGRAPAWCVATGKAMLAFAPPELLEGIEPRLHAYTPHSIIRMDELHEALAGVCRAGHAVNRGEWRADVFGLAAPVFNVSGQVVGAIGISGPAQRFGAIKLKRFAGCVRDAADMLAQTLGQRAAPRPVGLSSVLRSAH